MQVGRIRSITKRCARCGSDFNPHNGRAATSLWCSRSCWYASRRVYRVCPRCGREFYHLAGKPRNKCSRNCRVSDAEIRSRNAVHVSGNGYLYRYAPGHPSVQGKPYRYVAEHRLVMEEILGRRLEPFENVHHRDGDRKNNAPENLELWVVNQPAGQASVYLNELVRLKLRIAELEARVTDNNQQRRP